MLRDIRRLKGIDDNEEFVSIDTADQFDFIILREDGGVMLGEAPWTIPIENVESFGTFELEHSGTLLVLNCLNAEGQKSERIIGAVDIGQALEAERWVRAVNSRFYPLRPRARAA